MKIFAKHGTSEKVLIFCKTGNVKNIQVMLSEKYGGNWVWVDQLLIGMEFLRFDDGMKYQGFHENIDRYANGIEGI